MQKLQFIHNVNGDRSITANRKYHKKVTVSASYDLCSYLSITMILPTIIMSIC